MFEQAFLGQVRLAQAPPEKPPTKVTEDQLKKAIEDLKKKIDDLEKKPQRSKDDEDDLRRSRGAPSAYTMGRALAQSVYIQPPPTAPEPSVPTWVWIAGGTVLAGAALFIATGGLNRKKSLLNLPKALLEL
jgi:hypothetical protein